MSVIVPARNAARTIGACLEALRREGVPGPGAELLIVDDASTDGTAAVAAQPDVRVLRGDGRGPAAARNRGARAAHGEILIFLDADTAPCCGWLGEMLAPLRDPTIVAVKGRYRTNQRSLIARFAQLEFEEKYARLERAATVDFVDTGTAAYRRDAFLSAGGFDETFPASSAEDVDLAFRLAARGARFAFSPRAVVLHQHSESIRAYLEKKARYGYFRVRVYRRHPNKALGDSYTPPTMAVQIALAGAIPLLAALGVAGVRLARPAALAATAASGLTTLPLARRAAASDPGLIPAIPMLVFARAFAQGCGILGGLAIAASGRSGRGR